MQSKKRAKSIKFGSSKLQQPHSSIEREHPVIHAEDEKSPKEELHASSNTPTAPEPEKISEFSITEQESTHSVIINVKEQDTDEEEQSVPATIPNPEPVVEEQIPTPEVVEKEPEAPETPLATATENENEHVSETEDQAADTEDTTESPQNLHQDSEEEPAQPTDTGLSGDTYIVEKEIKKNMLGYFILVALLSFLIGIASMAGTNYVIKNVKMPTTIPYLSKLLATPTPTPEPTSIPTPTEKKVNLAAYNIEILNGSGITGAASKLKTSLTADGFKVTNTGNADNSDYTDTIIQASNNIDPDYLSELKNNLKKVYKLGPNAKIPASYTGSADIIITIGTSTLNSQ